METPKLLLLGLLMAVEPVTCQQGRGALEPWMQGLIAVAVFLALVAIAFAVNHFWCQENPEPVTMVMSVGGKSEEHLAGVDGKYSPMALNFRSSDHKNAYENENVMEDIPGVRSTPM